jgi:hypothetical protein
MEDVFEGKNCAALFNMRVKMAQGLNSSGLATGTHSITAAYSGDSNFSSVISSAVAELIQDFTVSTPTSSTTDLPSATVIPRGTAIYMLNISPSVGTVLPASVTLSLSGLPPGATGPLSPTTLRAESSVSSVTLTIQLPQTAELHTDFHKELRLAVTMLALLFLLLAGRMRRTAKGAATIRLPGVLLVAGTGAIPGLSGCGAKTTGSVG